MRAAETSRDQMLLWLLEAGAACEATNEDGETTLILAVRNGKTKAVKMLLELGANVAAKNSAGQTVMSVAERAGHGEIMQVLREPPPPKVIDIRRPEVSFAATCLHFVIDYSAFEKANGQEIGILSFLSCGISSLRRGHNAPFSILPSRKSLILWWARLGSNRRPLPCEGSALPLSYAPDGNRILHPGRTVQAAIKHGSGALLLRSRSRPYSSGSGHRSLSLRKYRAAQGNPCLTENSRIR